MNKDKLSKDPAKLDRKIKELAKTTTSRCRPQFLPPKSITDTIFIATTSATTPTSHTSAAAPAATSSLQLNG